jgi:hypothetical protein
MYIVCKKRLIFLGHGGGTQGTELRSSTYDSKQKNTSSLSLLRVYLTYLCIGSKYVHT